MDLKSKKYNSIESTKYIHLRHNFNVLRIVDSSQSINRELHFSRVNAVLEGYRTGKLKRKID